MSAHPQSRRLTNAQALLMQLFDRDLPETELHEMRNVLTKHLAKKAEAEAERILAQSGRTAKDVARDIAPMLDNRTAFLKSARTTKK